MNPLRVRPFTEKSTTVTLEKAKKHTGVREANCVKYIRHLDAIAFGELNYNFFKKRNVKVAFVDFKSGRNCKRIKVTSSCDLRVTKSAFNDHEFGKSCLLNRIDES